MRLPFPDALIQPHRVDNLALHHHTEIQMRPRAVACAAHPANHLTRFHDLTHLYEVGAVVAVACFHSVSVVQQDRPAPSGPRVVPRFRHAPCAGCQDHRTCRGRQVQPQVHGRVRTGQSALHGQHGRHANPSRTYGGSTGGGRRTARPRLWRQLQHLPHFQSY